MTSQAPCRSNSELPEAAAVHFRRTPPRIPGAQVGPDLPPFWGTGQGRTLAAGNAPKRRPGGRGGPRNCWAARCARGRDQKRRRLAHTGAGSPARDGTAESRAGGAIPPGPAACRAATAPPGAAALPVSATSSARLDPYPSPPLGARPPQPRMAVSARTHLRKYFARHDSGFPSASLVTEQVSGSLGPGAAAPRSPTPQQRSSFRAQQE